MQNNFLQQQAQGARPVPVVASERGRRQGNIFRDAKMSSAAPHLAAGQGQEEFRRGTADHYTVVCSVLQPHAATSIAHQVAGDGSQT